MSAAPQGNLLILGPSCSGKSTLAASLAERYGLRMIELDALAWDPGWNLAPVEVFRQRVTDAIAGNGWVAAGNYHAVRDILWPHATTAIWLDYGLDVTIPRIVRRSWSRWRSKELLWGTNRENFWVHFLPNDRSLVWFSARTHRERRRAYEVAMTDPQWAHLHWLRLKSPRAAERWLASLKAPESPPVASGGRPQPDS